MYYELKVDGNEKWKGIFEKKIFKFAIELNSSFNENDFNKKELQIEPLKLTFNLFSRRNRSVFSDLIHQFLITE